MRAPAKRFRPPLAVAALALLLTCGAAACGGGKSDGPAADGPLSSGVSATNVPQGFQCAPGREGPETFGDQQYTNYGHTTVILDRVVLLDPHNQRLIGSYAMPGTELVGSMPWPPHRPYPIPADWPRRQPVRGFRLAAGKEFNMVLGIKAIRTDVKSTSQGILVYYHDPSGSYVSDNRWANIIAATKTGC
jgi:hypothetical protein